MMSKEKHLEFIQGVINRHNSNSFRIKGWAITIASALYALSGTIDNPKLVLIALVPIIMFWGLDTFYLSNERCFVDLYNSIAKGKFLLPKVKVLKENFNTEDSIEGTIPEFEMNFKRFKIWKDNNLWEVLKSDTIFWFYLPLSILTILVWMFLAFTPQKPVELIDVNANLKSDGLEIKFDKPPVTIINEIKYPFKKDSLLKEKTIK